MSPGSESCICLPKTFVWIMQASNFRIVAYRALAPTRLIGSLCRSHRTGPGPTNQPPNRFTHGSSSHHWAIVQVPWYRSRSHHSAPKQVPPCGSRSHHSAPKQVPFPHPPDGLVVVTVGGLARPGEGSEVGGSFPSCCVLPLVSIAAPHGPCAFPLPLEPLPPLSQFASFILVFFPPGAHLVLGYS